MFALAKLCTLCGTVSVSISGLVVEYIVAINVTRVRFPADALEALHGAAPLLAGCAWRDLRNAHHAPRIGGRLGAHNQLALLFRLSFS